MAIRKPKFHKKFILIGQGYVCKWALHWLIDNDPRKKQLDIQAKKIDGYKNGAKKAICLEKIFSTAVDGCFDIEVVLLGVNRVYMLSRQTQF